MPHKRLRILAASLLLASAGVAASASAAWAERGDRGHDRRGGHDRGRDNHRGDHGRNDWNRDRGRDWDRGHDRGRNDWGRNDWRRDDHRGRRDRDVDVHVGLLFGQPRYYAPPPVYRYDPYPHDYYRTGYVWRPYECRTEIRLDYWGGRRADVEVRICADRYGSPYRVSGYDRFVRYRY